MNQAPQDHTFAPTLALPIQDPIGRVYREPGTTLPPNLTNILPNPIPKKLGKQLVLDNQAYPSITNIIDVLNKPYLNKWAAKSAITEAIEIESQYPGHILKNKQQAIKYFTKTHERDRDQAALNGSIVHNACENLAKNDPTLPPGYDPKKHNPYTDAWKAWLDRFQPEFLHLEGTVFGETIHQQKYAGTGDFIAIISGETCVGDYKTNRKGLHKEVSLQLNAIAHAKHIVTNPNLPLNEQPLIPPITRACAVSLLPGEYQSKEIKLATEPWEIFQSLRRAWEFHVLEGIYRTGEPILLKTMINGWNKN